MKTNEAPEKLYFGEADKRGILDIYSNREPNDEIEYTRTDAFIEKACDWFRTLDDKEPPYKTTEEFVEGFKKAMML